MLYLILDSKRSMYNTQHFPPLFSVEKAYTNQRALENEAKQLQHHVNQFSRQTTQWMNMLENFNQALKELGDVENWARTIEADITTVASALEYAYKGIDSFFYCAFYLFTVRFLS